VGADAVDDGSVDDRAAHAAGPARATGVSAGSVGALRTAALARQVEGSNVASAQHHDEPEPFHRRLRRTNANRPTSKSRTGRAPVGPPAISQAQPPPPEVVAVRLGGCEQPGSGPHVATPSKSTPQTKQVSQCVVAHGSGTHWPVLGTQRSPIG